MKAKQSKRNLISIAVLGLLFMIAMPVTAFADHRDRGRRGRDRDWGRDWNRYQRKCGKFINCHDARDGRWDRRGPRRYRVNNRWWNRDRDDWTWRNRSRRNFDRNDRRFIVRRWNFR
ncbi:MAG TPA: hypothetical protein VNO50_11820 [Pyrinomonadaceae bacterium]|nr:hypothetical protein [Pyrinomonadaceae bacterium]